MHKSRLAGFIIDCRTTDLHGAARFWSEALGMATEILPGQEGGTINLQVVDGQISDFKPYEPQGSATPHGMSRPMGAATAGA